jgi:ribosomal protein L16/L10AE
VLLAFLALTAKPAEVRMGKGLKGKLKKAVVPVFFLLEKFYFPAWNVPLAVFSVLKEVQQKLSLVNTRCLFER